MREVVQMQKAQEVIREFRNEIPLQKFLKNYFQSHKNMGARDRRQLASLVFNFFRLKGNRQIQNIPAAIIFASAFDGDVKNFYKYWMENFPSTTEHEKKELTEFSAEKYFPLLSSVSPEIHLPQFISSHQQKPKTFIRCRTEHFSNVLAACKNHQFLYSLEGNGIVSFSEKYPLDTLKEFEKGYFEIQDIAAQKTGEFFRAKEGEQWWDCCAGSGGKSLLLIDAEPDISLLATDARTSILKNLQMRLQKIHFKNYTSFELNLTEQKTVDAAIVDATFDGIIADVPCSGSGTWSRAPEWLSFFDEKQLASYVELQRICITNIVQKLKPGKPLVYITCSVYKEENEENVKHFTQQLPLQLEDQKYFQYSKEGGDTLFAARLLKL